MEKQRKRERVKRQLELENALRGGGERERKKGKKSSVNGVTFNKGVDV